MGASGYLKGRDGQRAVAELGRPALPPNETFGDKCRLLSNFISEIMRLEAQNLRISIVVKAPILTLRFV
jgi:hypothetical protein